MVLKNINCPIMEMMITSLALGVFVVMGIFISHLLRTIKKLEEYYGNTITSNLERIEIKNKHIRFLQESESKTKVDLNNVNDYMVFHLKSIVDAKIDVLGRESASKFKMRIPGCYDYAIIETLQASLLADEWLNVRIDNDGDTSSHFGLNIFLEK